MGNGFGSFGNVNNIRAMGQFTNAMFNTDIRNIGSKPNSTKKKVVKRVKKVVDNNEWEQEPERPPIDTSLYDAEEERREQVEKVEQQHRMLEAQQVKEMDRLRDAIMLTEIIGQPRCKGRYNRRSRRA